MVETKGSHHHPAQPSPSKERLLWGLRFRNKNQHRGSTRTLSPASSCSEGSQLLTAMLEKEADISEAQRHAGTQEKGLVSARTPAAAATGPCADRGRSAPSEDPAPSPRESATDLNHVALREETKQLVGTWAWEPVRVGEVSVGAT